MPSLRLLRDPGLSSLTSLFMYPSLLMSYKLNVHLSFSWTVPLSKIDRAVTKSWQMKEALMTLTTKPWGGRKLCLWVRLYDCFYIVVSPMSSVPWRTWPSSAKVPPLPFPTLPHFGGTERPWGRKYVLTSPDTGKHSLLWHCPIPRLQLASERQYRLPPEFKSLCYHFLAVWPWKKHSISLCLTVLFCKLVINNRTLPCGLLWGLNELIHAKH